MRFLQAFLRVPTVIIHTWTTQVAAFAFPTLRDSAAIPWVPCQMLYQNKRRWMPRYSMAHEVDALSYLFCLVKSWLRQNWSCSLNKQVLQIPKIRIRFLLSQRLENGSHVYDGMSICTRVTNVLLRRPLCHPSVTAADVAFLLSSVIFLS